MTDTTSETRDTRYEIRATSRIAVIGDTDFVTPFSALGLDTYPVGRTDQPTTEAAKEIIDRKYTLIIVAEDIAPSIEQVLADHQGQPTPCILVVPFTTESEGYATQSLAQALKLATGIDILQKSQEKDHSPQGHEVTKKS
jgi:V/A-type H+-transporting ATPase subunit F